VLELEVPLVDVKLSPSVKPVLEFSPSVSALPHPSDRPDELDRVHPWLVLELRESDHPLLFEPDIMLENKPEPKSPGV
jgi:hypothetical protein